MVLVVHGIKNLFCLSTTPAPLLYGVPQGSVLSCVLFFLYMLPLNHLTKYGVSYHCYADDVQLYLPLKFGKLDSLQPLFDCLNDFKKWMATNFLHLNESKTERLLFAPPSVVSRLTPALGPLTPYIRSHMKNLGCLFDSDFKLHKQIPAVIKSSFYHLRILGMVIMCFISGSVNLQSGPFAIGAKCCCSAPA